MELVAKYLAARAVRGNSGGESRQCVRGFVDVDRPVVAWYLRNCVPGVFRQIAPSAKFRYGVNAQGLPPLIVLCGAASRCPDFPRTAPFTPRLVFSGRALALWVDRSLRSATLRRLTLIQLSRSKESILVATRARAAVSKTSTGSPRRPSEGKKVNSSIFAAGALVLALATVMGALLFSTRGETATVWVAGTDLAAGHVLTSGDLSTLVVPTNTPIRATTTDINLEGRVLAMPIAAGASVSNGVLLADGDTFEAGDQLVEVGLKLLPGDVPAGIDVGDLVMLVELPTTTRDQEALLDEPVEAIVAEILGDLTITTASGIQITVAVDADLGEQVTRAAALDRIAVYVRGRG